MFVKACRFAGFHCVFIVLIFWWYGGMVEVVYSDHTQEGRVIVSHFAPPVVMA